MAWINLAASRASLRESASFLLDEWEGRTTLQRWAMLPGLTAYLSGEPKLIARADKLSQHLLADFYSDIADSALTTPEVLPDLVGLSVIAQIAGHDQSHLWARIAGARPARSPLLHALQNVVGQLAVTPAQISTSPEAPKVRHVHTEAQWLKLLGRAGIPELFDLSMTPDHPLWQYTLQSFVLPLGLLLFNAQEADDRPDIYSLFRLGAYWRRRGRVVYERQFERPDALSTPDPASPETWFGFDAIELVGQEMRVYHLLGFDWQAPLLFDKANNAFRFLDSIELSWRLVRQALQAQDWQLVDHMRSSATSVHIVAIDSSKVNVFDEDVQRAAAHYKLRLEVHDMTVV